VPVEVAEVVVADAADTWRSAGFEIDGAECEVGQVRIRLAGGGAGRGLVSWTLRGPVRDELDGLPNEHSDSAPPSGSTHPNGVFAVDHVVAFTPDLDRTVASLRSAGLDFRRLREEPTSAGAPRQAFFRVGDPVLEVIQAPNDSPVMADRAAPARFYGLAFLVRDLDTTKAVLGERLGDPRDAVQPGRRIATLRRSAGLTVPVAFMTPRA
jgi:catechol 2,3-dioxygenase-like lactoylglutathione lyase family enzyme